MCVPPDDCTSVCRALPLSVTAFTDDYVSDKGLSASSSLLLVVLYSTVTLSRLLGVIDQACILHLRLHLQNDTLGPRSSHSHRPSTSPRQSLNEHGISTPLTPRGSYRCLSLQSLFDTATLFSHLSALFALGSLAWVAILLLPGQVNMQPGA